MHDGDIRLVKNESAHFTAKRNECQSLRGLRQGGRPHKPQALLEMQAVAVLLHRLPEAALEGGPQAQVRQREAQENQIVATKKMLAAEAAAGPPDGAAGDVRHLLT